jgi:hypothetical protein
VAGAVGVAVGTSGLLVGWGGLGDVLAARGGWVRISSLVGSRTGLHAEPAMARMEIIPATRRPEAVLIMSVSFGRDELNFLTV